MIYSFFEPDADVRPGMGNYIIMDHIVRARKSGLPYVYLGYWVEGSKRMQYKVRYQPMERLGPGGWVRFDGDAPASVPPVRATVMADGGPVPIQPRELANLFRK
jgi:arginine-tRNA-protein transferase